METKNLEIKTLQKKEAIIRMKRLNILPKVISEFENDDVVLDF